MSAPVVALGVALAEAERVLEQVALLDKALSDLYAKAKYPDDYREADQQAFDLAQFQANRLHVALSNLCTAVRAADEGGTPDQARDLSGNLIGGVW